MPATPMDMSQHLPISESWHIAGVNDAEKFFRAVGAFLPEATHLYLEGVPAKEIMALLSTYGATGDYQAPIGTLWSLPRSRRLGFTTSPAFFARLAEIATSLAEPEICYHLHVYRSDEPLLQWFDAFSDPLAVSRNVSRERVEQFCIETGGTLDEMDGNASTGP